MEERTLKIVILGDGGVGKTCLMSRFINGRMGSGDSTMGSAYFKKEIYVNELKYTCEFWDVSGNKKFQTLAKLFLNDSKIVILVYDITKKSSFKGLELWLDMVVEKLGTRANLILVGNKIDLYEDEEMSEQTARKFAELIKAKFVLASAMEGRYHNWNSFLENEIKNYINKTK